MSSTGDGQVAPAASPASAEALVFGGRTFTTREELDHFVASASGRHKALEQRLQAADAQAREAAKVARAWYDFRRGEQGGADPQGRQPAPQQPAVPEKAWADTIDYDTLEDLAQNKGLRFAMHFLATQAEKRMNAIVDQREQKIHSTYQPITQRHQAAELLDQTWATYNELRDSMTEAGAAMFPELSQEDPEVANAIVRIWTSYPQEFTLSPQTRKLAWQQAIYEYRMQTGWNPGSAPRTAPRTPTSGGASSGVLRAAERAAQGAPVLDGSGTPRAAAVPVGGESPQAALARELSEVTQRELRSKDGISLGVRAVA